MMKKLFLFLMLMTAVVVNAQTKSAVQEVRDYLHECGIFYIATVDGDQPRVRPFGVAEVLNGKLYIQTGKKKKVFKQMMANPKFEITAVKPSGTEWIRISGKLVNDDSREAKAYVLDKKSGTEEYVLCRRRQYGCALHHGRRSAVLLVLSSNERDKILMEQRIDI